MEICFRKSLIKVTRKRWVTLRFTHPTVSTFFGGSGFTLIETLVAMMILSICLVTIFQLFSGGLKSSRVSEDYTRAVFYAREKMEEILMAEKLQNAVLEGDFEDNFKWKAKIIYLEPLEKEKKKIKGLDLFDIRVTVIWNTGKNEKFFEINTLKIAEKIEVKDGI